MKHLRLKLISSAMLCALGAVGATTAIADGKGTAYVSNQEGGVTIIDLNVLEAKRILDVGAKGPRGIGITADGKLLITANKDDANISVIDLTTGKATLVPIGKNPEFVRVYGDRAYVTYEPGSSGAPAKPGADAAKPDAAKPNAAKADAAKPAEAAKAGAAKDDDDDNVPGHIAIVDLKTDKVIKDIVGKPETEGLEFSKDGKRLIVANESDNSITVHDTQTGKLLRSVSVSKFGERPRGIKLSPDGKTYVVTLELSDKLLVLDEKLNPIKAVSTGKSPYGVSFDRDGKHVFVASSKDKILQVYDAKTFDKIKDIPTGERCWHFTFTPDGLQLLLACGRSSELVVVDTQKLEVAKRIANKDMPWGIVTYPKSMGSLDQP